jgi:flagellar basal-body rod protein FlgB
MLNFLDTQNFKAMQKSLDLMARRMEVTAHNIANVNTPHFKAQRLEYENLFQEKLAQINNSYAKQMRYSGPAGAERLQRYFENIKPAVFTDNETETRVDGNNVDIDHENLQIARIQIQYNFMIRKITDEYNLLRHAISEGRQ